MACIPDQAIVWNVKDLVQGQGQLDRPEVGGEVAPVAVHDLEHALTDLLAELFQLFQRQGFEILGVIDFREYFGHERAQRLFHFVGAEPSLLHVKDDKRASSRVP